MNINLELVYHITEGGVEQEIVWTVKNGGMIHHSEVCPFWAYETQDIRLGFKWALEDAYSWWAKAVDRISKDGP